MKVIMSSGSMLIPRVARVKKLIVIFDDKDVVMNYVYSDSTVPSEMKF